MMLNAIRDQVVDGQVETLLTLERSAASMRASAEELATVAEQPLRDVAELLEGLQSAAIVLGGAARDAVATVATAVDDAVSAAARHALREAGEVIARVHAESDAAEASLALAVRDAAATVATAVDDAVSAASRHTLDTSDEAIARVHAQSGAAEASLALAVRDAAAELSESVERTLGFVAQEGERAADALRQVIASGVGHLEQAQDDAAAAAEQVRAAGADAVAAIDDAGATLANQFAGQIAAAAAMLERWEQRDARRERRVEERVDAFISRVEVQMTGLASRLGSTGDRLVALETDQEGRRADEFARVLDDVLGRAGVRGRKLRERTLQVLRSRPPADGDRKSVPEPVSAADEALPAPAPAPRAKRAQKSPAATAPTKSPAKTPSPRKAGPRPASASSSPSGARPAPAKSARPRKTSVAKQENP